MAIPGKLVPATEEHEALYQDLIDVLRKHAAKVPPLQVLAVLANMVGKVAALQDQGKVTPAIAMAVITHNITKGNQDVMEDLLSRPPEGNA